MVSVVIALGGKISNLPRRGYQPTPIIEKQLKDSVINKLKSFIHNRRIPKLIKRHNSRQTYDMFSREKHIRFF